MYKTPFVTPVASIGMLRTTADSVPKGFPPAPTGCCSVTGMTLFY